MSIDPAQLQAQQNQNQDRARYADSPVNPLAAQPITTTVSATSASPAANASAIGDVANGSIVGSLQADAARSPRALFTAVGALLLVVLAAFVYLLIESVHNDNGTAQHYLNVVFSATAVWVVIAGVLGVGLLNVRSPLQDPPSIPGVSYPKGK